MADHLANRIQAMCFRSVVLCDTAESILLVSRELRREAKAILKERERERERERLRQSARQDS
jgi:hypothetical protein